MRPAFVIILFLLCCRLCLAQPEKGPRQEMWQDGYTGADATGAHVRGYWKFDAGGELADSSGKGNDLTASGAKSGVEGRFGLGIESFPGFPISRQQHSVRTAGTANLLPAGAFSLEMWVRPKPEFADLSNCYLADAKYVPDNHTGFSWQIVGGELGPLRRLAVTLGFGVESQTFSSNPFTLVVGEWQHVAFTYDGAGTVVFYHNGSIVGRVHKPGFRGVMPPTKPLHLGDRVGSNYGGFPGYFDEARLCQGALRFEPVALEIAPERRVWRRLEKAESVTLRCTNLKREVQTGVRLSVEFAGATHEYPLQELRPGDTREVWFPVNTSLRPQAYPLVARLEAAGATAVAETSLRIVARPPPNQMPVIMWGTGPEDFARVKDIGFTHCLGLHSDAARLWEDEDAPLAETLERQVANRDMLDRALTEGLGVIASISPSRWLEGKTEWLRVGRDGKPFARKDICASLPFLPQYYENFGKHLGKTYGDHPAYAATLINTEVRDNSRPSFNPIDVENYRKFAGAEIPAEVDLRTGVEWAKLPDFPKDRVVPENHPILKYYRWFWTEGDGWNALHTALHKGVRGFAQRDHWTFFDPAVRQPSLGGAGGTVDVISHWTYTYPDPQRIGLCTDQLFAMSAASGRRQAVMKMTQLIWYRSQTAPARQGQVVAEPVAWEDQDPGAAYITIAPMHLKEAFWTKLARPVRGIMYHGWQSLVPTDSTGAYRHTHADTAPVLRDLIQSVVKPLGPALMSIPDDQSEVALLESFTSQMFARRGGYGSNMTWSADLWLALQHAHVQTDILFEETLVNKGGLSGRKVLIMPECDVLTPPVVSRIQDWQKKGGRIIADEFLCPALKADVVLPSFKRGKKADEDKARVLDLARQIAAIQPPLPKKMGCDNAEVIVRTRRFGDTTYVFAINDRREFGGYVGQHGLVMENGLPSSATLSLQRDRANVYDLTRGSLIVPTRGLDGGVSWSVDLGPCDGRIYMVTSKPLLGIQLGVPESAARGNRVAVRAMVTTTQQSPLKAVLPLRLEVRDASGNAAEGTGYYAAENGILDVDLDLAANEDPGVWEIRVKELASGMEAVRYLRVGR